MLKTNNVLGTLYLIGNKIDDKHAKNLGDALKVNASLHTLWLGNNNIGPDGVKHLSEGLKENHFLCTLDLDDNNVGDQGCKYLAEALEVNDKLGSLSLANNKISDDGIICLTEPIRKSNRILHALDLYGNTRVHGALDAIVDTLRVNKRMMFSFKRGEIDQSVDGEAFKEFDDITVSFEGEALGFSIASRNETTGEQIGPYIRRVAPNGHAAMKGVEENDYIRLVNDIPIKKQMSWEECRDIVLGQPKPVTIVFERPRPTKEDLWERLYFLD